MSQKDILDYLNTKEGWIDVTQIKKDIKANSNINKQIFMLAHFGMIEIDRGGMMFTGKQSFRVRRMQVNENE